MYRSQHKELSVRVSIDMNTATDFQIELSTEMKMLLLHVVTNQPSGKWMEKWHDLLDEFGNILQIVGQFWMIRELIKDVV